MDSVRLPLRRFVTLLAAVLAAVLALASLPAAHVGGQPAGRVAPVADFTGTPLAGTSPLAVTFSDASTGTFTTWAWTFGDGGTSTLQNPTHTYTSDGTYTVSLTVDGIDGPDTRTRTDYVQVGAPTADFAGTPLAGANPLGVTFTDLSTGAVTAWAWDFGDSGTSTLQNPTHSYTVDGTYTVTLTVTGPGGSDAEVKTDYVFVGAPVAEFSGTPLAGANPLAVTFTDLSTGSVTAWAWDFGDSGTSTLQNPTHSYTIDGTYTVTLTVTGPGGSDAEVKTDYVSVGAPVAEFSGTPLAGANPLGVTFTDLSTGSVTAWAWDFGDSGTSTLQNPTHSYTVDGTYTVTLTATGPGGSDAEVKTDYVSVGAPVAEFSGTPLAGANPLGVTFTDLSTGSVTAWAWDFGDSGTSTLQNPTHTYTADGTYTVALTATSPGGSDVETKVDYVFVGAPTAEFSGSPLSGTAPLLVTFSDATSGAVTAWAWTFGDGGTSTLQNPTHSYAAAGTYTVALTASGPGGSDLETKVDYVTVAEPAPTAEFSGSPLSGTAPLLVTFTDATSGAVTAWAWTFGDGGTSTLQNPTHSYAAAGTYTVALTASGPGGSDLETKVDYVTVAEPAPTAEFSGSPLSGTAPLLVTFTDATSGAVTAWAWTFGDGGTSTLQNPTHTYTAGGSYTVTLTATGPGGSDPESKVNYVVVVDPAPVADFSGTPRAGASPLLVTFTDLTSGPLTAWAWTFGDGGTSTLQNPTHTYTTSGTYTVGLTATGPGGMDLETKAAYIYVDPTPPTAAFSGTPLLGDAPLLVSFTDASTGIVTAWAWTFGDGGTSTLASPTHTYTIPGTYSVALSASGPGGKDLETKTGYVVVEEPPPVADFVASPLSGPAPLTVNFMDMSSGNVFQWGWTFGDLDFAVGPMPSHTYTVEGTYTVSLTVTSAGGGDTETKIAYIVVAPPPVAAFSASRTLGVDRLAVQFSDLSTGDVSSWGWSFGDGGTSSQQHPAHVYTAPGTYSVTLTATGPGGPDTAFAMDLIVVKEGPTLAQTDRPLETVGIPDHADFFGSPRAGVAPLTVRFTNLSTGLWLRNEWDFGDGAGVIARHTEHTYTTPGTYAVTLDVFRAMNAETDQEQKVAYVVVAAPLLALEGGSFEPPAEGVAPGSPWNALGAGGLAVHGGGPADGAMPTDRGHWAELSAEGTVAALPPTPVAGEGTPPTGATGFAQTFAFEPLLPHLAFDAIFLRAGPPGRSDRNDFLSVDVSDGERSLNVFLADSFTPTPGFSALHDLPATERQRVLVDLAELFPAADRSTLLTLSVQIGNGGDGEDSSRGQVDDFRLLPRAGAVERPGRGLNADCYRADEAVPGRTWHAVVDTRGVPFATRVLVVGSERPESLVRPTLGELLIDVSRAPLFHLEYAAGRDATEIAVPLPPDTALAGRVLHTQAFVEGQLGLRACQAIDLIIGY